MLHIESAMITKSGIIMSSGECEYEKSFEIGAFREIICDLYVTGVL